MGIGYLLSKEKIGCYIEDLTNKNTQSNNSSFLQHIHYMRGIAIINIVFIHVLRIPQQFNNFKYSGSLDIFREVIFHDSSIYFLFVSGFLFYYLSPKYTTMSYYLSKFKYIILPYIILSLIFFTTKLLVPQLLNNEFNLIHTLQNLKEFLLLGKAQLQYWYIPFISIIFLISPLILKIPEKLFNIIFILSCLFPLLGTRNGITICIGKYAYFAPIYFIGVYSAKRHEFILEILKKRNILFLISSVFSTILLFYIEINHIEYKNIYNIKEALFYIQKISLTFFLLYFLSNKQDQANIIIDKFAKYSFAIFFIHLQVHGIFHQYYFDMITHTYPKLILPATIFYAFLVSLLSLLFAVMIKKVLRGNSKFFIGV